MHGVVEQFRRGGGTRAEVLDEDADVRGIQAGDKDRPECFLECVGAPDVAGGVLDFAQRRGPGRAVVGGPAPLLFSV